MTERASLLAFCVSILCGLLAMADDKVPKFQVQTRKMNDTVQVQGDHDKVVFDVKSPSGIGGATIERAEKAWPAAVSLKLHLNGLESLVVSTGKVKLSAAVSIHDGKLGVRQWKNDKEDEPLNQKSPLWMDIRPIGADGKPAERLPLKDGWFEVTLPKALLESNPPSLDLQWIDFYRG